MEHNSHKGFSLIEVMAALAVMAIGISAAISAVTSVSGNTLRLEQKMVTQWLVANRLVEYQLKAYEGTLKNATSSNSSQTIAGQKWYLKEAVKDVFDSSGKEITLTICSDQAYLQCYGEQIVYVAYQEFELK